MTSQEEGVGKGTAEPVSLLTQETPDLGSQN